MIVRIGGIKRVHAKGRIYYYHRKTGKRINAPPDTLEFIEAVRLLDAAPRPSPERNKARGTWGALVGAYRASPEYGRLAPRTRSDYQKVFDYLAGIDEMPLVQLDGAALIRMRDKTFRQKKRRFSNHLQQVMGTVLNWGRPRGLSSGNPAAGLRKIQRPRDMPKANRAWRESERAAVLEAATGGLQLAIALGMFSGMRIGDAVRVTWSIYDGRALEWRQGKTGDMVWMPAAAELRTLLDAAPRTATTIVTGINGRPLKESGLAKAFRTLIQRLEGEGAIGDGLTFHGLRHSIGKAIGDERGDIGMTQAMLGQRTPAMAAHYSREADRRRAASAAVQLLDRARARGKPDGKPGGGSA